MHLGATLRTVAFAPRRGFARLARDAERRESEGAALVIGLAPYLLAATGGASAMLLWLKVSTIVGVRDLPAGGYRWDYLATALVAGALVALVAQLACGAAGAAAARALGGRARARHLRLVWGASAFPQVAAIALLLPLDLAIVGPRTFTSERLTDPLEAVWAAFSIAIAVSLALWSVALFERGVEAVAGIGVLKATGVTALCAAGTAAATAAVAAGAVAAS